MEKTEEELEEERKKKEEEEEEKKKRLEEEEKEKKRLEEEEKHRKKEEEAERLNQITEKFKSKPEDYDYLFNLFVLQGEQEIDFVKEKIEIIEEYLRVFHRYNISHFSAGKNFFPHLKKDFLIYKF